MKKPEMKKEMAIDHIFLDTRELYVYATKDAIEDLREFGEVLHPMFHGPDLYLLSVDARFDFREVVSYIENYDKE